MSEKKINTDKEKKPPGGINKIILSVISAYTAFTFFNPKLFDTINNIVDSENQWWVFISFNILYLWLPLFGFWCIASLRKNLWTGIFQNGKLTINTKELFGYFSLFLLPVIITIFSFLPPNNTCDSSYKNSFAKLDTLRTHEAYLQKIDSIKQEVLFNLLTTQNRFISTSKYHDQPKDSTNFSKKIKKLFDVIGNNKNDGVKKTVFDLAKISLSDTTRDSYIANLKSDQLLRNLSKLYRIELYKEGLSLREMFEKQFNSIRFNSLIILSLILIVLITIFTIFCFQKRIGSSPGRMVSTLLTVYLLITFQMLGPIKAEHIQVERPGFQFDHSNWYMPAYISQVTHSTVYNNASYNKYTGIPYDDEDIVLLLEEIRKDVARAEAKIITAIDSIDSGKNTIKKELDKHISGFNSYKKNMSDTTGQFRTSIMNHSDSIATNDSLIGVNKDSIGETLKVIKTNSDSITYVNKRVVNRHGKKP